MRQKAKLRPTIEPERKTSGNDSSVRSPTSTTSDVRSPTSTSTKAYTRGNITVTGGAGAGATTRVTVRNPMRGKMHPIYFLAIKSGNNFIRQPGKF